MTMMHQCRLRRGNTETVGWIEERGAKVGATVRLLTDGALWRVATVYRFGLDEEQLRAKQAFDRNSLPSLRN